MEEAGAAAVGQEHEAVENQEPMPVEPGGPPASEDGVRNDPGSPPFDRRTDHDDMQDPSVKLMSRVEKELAAFHERSAAQEELVMRMQSRIEELQSDQVRTLLGPVVRMLVAVQSKTEDARDRHRAGTDPAVAWKDLDYIVDEIGTLLGLLELESIEAAAGDLFDPALHRAVKIVPTADPARDRTVTEVRRQGFRFAGEERTYLQAQVAVHRFDPALSGEQNSEPAHQEQADKPEAVSSNTPSTGSTFTGENNNE